tara:strand:+ start:2931 stop:3803 length:873 start_codon:yes stop_codon:yes gene_type:complete
MADEYQMEEGESTELPEENPGEEIIDVVEPADYLEDEPEGEFEDVEEQEESSDFRDEQYLWGQQLGLARDQVEAFGTPEAFDSMVERVAANFQDDEEEPEPQMRPAAEPKEFSEYVLEDPQDYDEGIVKFVEYANGALKNMNTEVTGLRQENSKLIEAEYARNAETNVAEFERIVNTMDEATFGRGEQDDLASQEADSRMRLAEAVSRLGHGYEARGEDIPPMSRLVEEASGAVFGKEIKNQTLRKASERSRQQRSQASALPTHEESSPLTSDEAAVKAATEWQQDKGWR